MKPKKCEMCNIVFNASNNDRPNSWNRRRFCSSNCCNNRANRGQFKNGHQAFRNSGSFQKGQIPWNWKGQEVGYSALHSWVKRHLGKPTTCENCGKVGLMAQKIHWANKSHKYFRDLNDWIRLCAKCHKQYDKK